MSQLTYEADVAIVGGGIAGMIAALELLNEGKKVIIIDRDTKANFGGLAKWAFGGMFFVNSKHQQKRGINDSIDLATKDWYSFAEFTDDEVWGKRWADQYINFCTPHGYQWLRDKNINFFPAVHWVERGLKRQGNSVPRFHLLWGTGWELVEVMKKSLLHHPKKENLQLQFEHRVKDINTQNNTIIGVNGIVEKTGEEFEVNANNVVIATGGINGSIEKVKENWYKPWGAPPKVILNGAHPFAVGDLHDATQRINGNLSNLNLMWNYAAGVHHNKPQFQGHGLSLVPCKSAVWVNYKGERFMDSPLVTAYDTRYLCERICAQEKKYSWQILNKKIALKEFAISGSEHNPAVRDKKLMKFLTTILFGNKSLINEMTSSCKDFVVANSVEELADKMNALTGNNDVNASILKADIQAYDKEVVKGKNSSDEQVQLIAKAREYTGDRVRTSKFQRILDKRAMPLIAIREFIISRKSLGGIQTDLQCKVLTQPDATGNQQTIEGLYAIGEAAGFGGGGIHGKRSLEGTFLGGCVITARVAAKAIANQVLA